MIDVPTRITFFERLIPSILAGNKTITIRDKTENHYVPNSIVSLHALETNVYYGELKILSVKSLHFNDISVFHAQQEAMTLSELKTLIHEIYPDEGELYVIDFELTKIAG